MHKHAHIKHTHTHKNKHTHTNTGSHSHTRSACMYFYISTFLHRKYMPIYRYIYRDTHTHTRPYPHSHTRSACMYFQYRNTSTHTHKHTCLNTHSACMYFYIGRKVPEWHLGKMNQISWMYVNPELAIPNLDAYARETHVGMSPNASGFEQYVLCLYWVCTYSRCLYKCMHWSVCL